MKQEKMKKRIGKDAVIVILLFALLGGVLWYLNQEDRKAEQENESHSAASVDETEQTEDPNALCFYEVGGSGGNHYVGEEFPAGDYQFTAGNGVVSLRLCEDGEVLQEWLLSAEEGYERDLEHLVLKDGQILVSDGSPNWRMTAEFPAGQIPASEEKDQEGGVKAPEYLDLPEGIYTVGEDLEPGDYRAASCEEEQAVSVVSSHPYEGGIDAVLYPRTERNQMFHFSGIRLQEGDTVTIKGGTVRWIREDEE